MDSSSSYILSLLLLLLFLFLFTKLIKKLASPQNPSPRLPPGPRQLPIIGSLHHLLGSDLPHHRFLDLSSKYGPLIHLQLGERSTVVASSPDAAREIMKTHDAIFATRPLYETIDIISYNGRNITFGPYGDHWRQLRKVAMLELLSPKRVSSYRYIREDEVGNLITSLSSLSGSTVNLSKNIYATINNISARAVMGNRCKEQEEYLEALDEEVRILGGFNPADMFPSAAGLINMVTGVRAKVTEAHRKTDRILQDILNEHREKRRLAKKQRAEQAEEEVEEEEKEDVVDVLLRLQQDKSLQFELTEDTIKAVMADLIGAATETSSTVIQWVMSELVNNPRVMNKVQSEVREAFRGQTGVSEAGMNTGKLNYLHQVVKETLRLHTPVPLLLPRECMKSCKLLGYDVPEKTCVIINAWAIGRDPQYWEDAEEFQPERFEENKADFRGANFEFVPFGAGRRICPGMVSGLLNVEFALAQMLYYFNWEIPGGGEGRSLDMSESFGIAAKRKSDLCLRVISHTPCSTA